MHFISSLDTKVKAWLEKEDAYDTKFLFLPVAMGAGAIAYFELDFEPALNQLIALICLLALLRLLWQNTPTIALITGMMLAASCGALLAKLETLRLDTNFITHEMIVPISARLITIEPQESSGYRLIVRIITSQNQTAEINDDDKLAGKIVRLTTRSLPENIKISSGLSGLVKLRPPSGPVRAGSYDFGFHQFYRGISATGFFMGQPQAIEIAPPSGILDQFSLAISALRVKMSEHIRAAIQGENGAIASALITGQRGGISEETAQSLRIAGLAHILAISGLHMAMVTGMVLLISRAILGLFIHFSSHHAPKKIAALTAIILAAFYLLLSGADIAAQRSFIMVGIMLLAVLCDRAAITMRNLSLAALVILILTPHEILSPSFQMSFAATAALIASFGWWTRRQYRQKKQRNNGFIWRFFILPPLSTAIASIIAGGASGIFTAYHFANVAPLGIIGNVAALPVMSLLVMPPALISAILISVDFEYIPLQIMDFGIAMIKAISVTVANLSPDITPGMLSPIALIFLSLSLVILFFMQSALRLVALIPLLIGGIIYATMPSPLIIIEEEGKLVAVQTPTGKIALSHDRPNDFTLKSWLPVFGKTAQDILLPRPDEGAGFICHGLTCQVKMANGKIFAMALGASGQARACNEGDIVFLNYISFEEINCANARQLITRRDLTKSGAMILYAHTAYRSAFATCEASAQDSRYKVKWAREKSLRPWNAHHHQAKAAIGLP